MAVQNKPAAEIDITVDMVRELLTEQMPDLAHLDIVSGPCGWDNCLFRVGSSFAARLPRRQMGAMLVEAEQRWLPLLAPSLPLPIAAPVRSGVANQRFPWSWSLVPWFEGDIAARAELSDPGEGAQTIGAFCAALHTPAPPDAPVNPYRGIALEDRTEAFANYRPQVADVVDLDAVDRAWQRCVEAPAFEGEPVWLHGDLHPGNVIVRDGNVAGVIDFGDIGKGDRATDLAIAFMMFGPTERSRFRAAAGMFELVDDATWMRARGWALTLGIMHLVHSADGPHHETIGRRAINAVLEELR